MGIHEEACMLKRYSNLYTFKTWDTVSSIWEKVEKIDFLEKFIQP